MDSELAHHSISIEASANHFDYNAWMSREEAIKNIKTVSDAWSRLTFTAHCEAARVAWTIMQAYVQTAVSIELLLEAGTNHDADARILIRRQYELVTLLAWLLIDFDTNVKIWRANAANYYLKAIKTAGAEAQVSKDDQETLKSITAADAIKDGANLKQRAKAIDKHYDAHFNDKFERLYGVIYSALSADAHCEPKCFSDDRNASESWLEYHHHLSWLFFTAVELVEDVNKPQGGPTQEPA